jgi:RNA polymerase sigma factor (sigma-70 family)
MSPERAGEVLALDEALRALEQIDARRSRVVELRYFGGLSIEETAEVLRVKPITVSRDWRWAKAWLYRALTEQGAL